MSGTRTQKLVLFTGFSCNNRCAFCMNLDKRGLPEKSTREVLRELAAAKAAGVEYLELIGGEPTIREDFLPLLRAARKLAFKDLVLVTNGRMLAYPEFAREAVSAGVTKFILSLHGPDAALHDGLTGSPGAFEQLLRGAANLRALGVRRLFANCTVVRPNMARLPELGRLLLGLGILDAEFIFVDPNAGGPVHEPALVPRISEAAPFMRQVLDAGRAGGTRDWAVRYVPLCHFQGYLEQVSELREVAVFHTRHWAPDFRNEDVAASRREAGRRKTERCRGCRLFEPCEGLWTGYLERFGDSELSPVRGADA